MNGGGGGLRRVGFTARRTSPSRRRGPAGRYGPVHAPAACARCLRGAIGRAEHDMAAEGESVGTDGCRRLGRDAVPMDLHIRKSSPKRACISSRNSGASGSPRDASIVCTPTFRAPRCNGVAKSGNADPAVPPTTGCGSIPCATARASRQRSRGPRFAPSVSSDARHAMEKGRRTQSVTSRLQERLGIGIPGDPIGSPRAKQVLPHRQHLHDYISLQLNTRVRGEAVLPRAAPAAGSQHSAHRAQSGSAPPHDDEDVVATNL